MIILDYIDEEVIKRIHDDSFPLPDLSNPLYVSQKTVIDEGDVVAAGLVRLTAEGILITNQSLPAITRARASKELIEALKKDCKGRGLDECHAFVKNSVVAEFLFHLGFQKCQAGQPLIIHF
jgi:N-acetylglutamate synthase-like GNAT family acetyltransferase